MISITPTSPKPPENVLSQAMEDEVKGGTEDGKEKVKVGDEKERGEISGGGNAGEGVRSPESRPKPSKEPRLPAKPKPLCLDAALLEHNLNTLKRNSGSVNLATMNILPPYINVVTPSKLSEARPIQIDPKRAIIHGLTESEPQTSGGLINGPLTELPYADSDSNGSGGHNGFKRRPHEAISNGKKAPRRASGDFADSEISC